MLPSGLPPTAAELAAEAARFKPLAAVPPTVKLSAGTVQALSNKQLKKLAPVAKLNAAQAAKLDAQELEAYRQARLEEKRQKKLARTQQAPADKAKTKAAAKLKEADAAAAKKKQQDDAAAAVAAVPKAPKPPKVVAAPAPPSQSTGTNPALRSEGLKKKDETVRALERAQRKRARLEAAGGVVPELSVEQEIAQTKRVEADAHVQKLDDMRSARMAAVAERDAGDIARAALRGQVIAPIPAAPVAAGESPAAAAAAAAGPITAAALAIATPAVNSAVAIAEASAMHAKPLWMQRGKQVSPLSSVDVADFHFHPAIQAQLRTMGIERFFATQSEVIPVILKSYGINDVCCCAPTGSGQKHAHISHMR